MFQQTPLEKYYKSRKIIDSKVSIKIRNIFYPALLKLTKAKVKYTIVKDNDFEKMEGHPVIFAVNHSRFQDTPIVCQIVRDVMHERAYILAGKQKLGLIDNLFFFMYGSIFVDRKNEEDKILFEKYKDRGIDKQEKGTVMVQNAMKEYLNIGIPIITFPEATWNMDDSLLMLPMKWGNCKIAQATDSQIIPLILNYDNKNMQCHVHFEKPHLISKDACIREENENIRSIMAFERLEYIRKNQVKRDEIDIEQEQKRLKQPVKEYPNYDYEYEQSIVFQSNESPDKVFAPIKKLQLKKENAFLFYKNNTGMH